ncbi:protein kinase domain-containing protein [Kurthia huakuii]|uniref:protein kinase domain-containing protein n=1 Tax=Kurthia huakuii TaxID=1421019 RepID=UPI0004975309|nr:protein kinase [Kurthia huakuii]MBM7699294.1 serine/threonine protein kinase [Kurthia huakuii]
MKKTLENFQELSTNQKFLEFIATDTPFTYSEMLQKNSANILYLVENRRTQEKIVLKRMRKRTLNRSKYEKRFEQEQQILRALQLENVPQWLANGFVAKVPFFMMSYIEGRPILDNGPYAVIDALRMIQRVSIVLKKIHLQGYVHRHLTPENIIVHAEKLAIVGFDQAAKITLQHSPTEELYKQTTVCSDIDQLARLFLLLTDETGRLKWRKAEVVLEQRRYTQKINELLSRAMGLNPLFESLEMFDEALATCIDELL